MYSGIALSGTIGATLTVGILTWLLHRRGLRVVNGPFLTSLIRCILATCVLFIVIWFAANNLGLFHPLSGHSSSLSGATLSSLGDLTGLSWSDWFVPATQESISRLQLGIRLGITVAAGTATYAVCLIALRHPEALYAFKALRRRLKRS